MGVVMSRSPTSRGMACGWLAVLGGIFALFVGAASANAEGKREAPLVPASSENARDILARHRPSLIQIEGFVGDNTARLFHGTGFAVAGDGVFMTNYHVVSAVVQHGEKYRLTYRTPDGQTGPVSVIAVDVRNDLALVRAADHRATPLTFRAELPQKGERAYSIGFPLDVGLTITEGVSNGKVADTFDARIHYSGAINGGMSGGPALNASGEVIGINVSGYRFQQLVSFLVPASHGVALLAAAQRSASTTKDLQANVLSQLQAHSDALLGALAAPMVTQTSASYDLPAKLAPFIDCSAVSDPTRVQIVTILRINCQAKAGLYLEQGRYIGDLRFNHTVLTTEKLDAWRFAARMSRSQADWFTSAVGLPRAPGQRRHLGPYACRRDTVALKGFDAHVVICTRSHRKLQGLYDFNVSVTSLDGDRAGFESTLAMTGLAYGPAMTFVRRYLDAMERKPFPSKS